MTHDEYKRLTEFVDGARDIEIYLSPIIPYHKIEMRIVKGGNGLRECFLMNLGFLEESSDRVAKRSGKAS